MPETAIVVSLGETLWQITPNDVLKNRIGVQTVEDQITQKPFKAVFVFFRSEVSPCIKRGDLSINLRFLFSQFF